jgi:two-component system sensor histidine kinase KdpD
MSAQKTTSRGGITPLRDIDPYSAFELIKAPFAVRYLAAFMMTAVAAAVAVGVDSTVTIPNLSLVFVIPVVIAAVIFGLGSSLFSAILGALAYNFFLTEPRYTLIVDDPANIWAIGLLFVVGCTVSAVASTARHRTDDAVLLERQAKTLQTYSRDILAADNPRAIASTSSNALEVLFKVPVVVMIMSPPVVDLVEKRGKFELFDVEVEAGRASLTDGTVIPARVYPFDASRFDFWPVTTSTGQRAVIGLAFDPGERPSTVGTLVEIIGSLLALALDRQHLKTD